MTLNKRKALPVILSAVMLLTMIPVRVFGGAFIVDNGTCGKNLTWTLDDMGRLTISGTGDMYAYDYDASPFYCNYSISRLIIEPGVTSICNYAFTGCSGLIRVTIPNGVKSIGDRAFLDCTGLTSITIPDTVTYIGDLAFDGCSGLKSINIPDSIRSIGECAFIECSGLTSITLPNSVTSIGQSAFAYTAYYNEDSNWSDGFLYIGNHLIRAKEEVQGTYKIKGGTVSIADLAFSGCTGLTSVTIPDSVISIGSGAFNECSGLTNITIPDGVTSIKYSTFCDCSALSKITIPDSVTSISDFVFYNTAYYNDKSNWSDGVLYIGNHLIKAKHEIQGSYTIKEGTVSIADFAFDFCDGLTNVSIPDSVKGIGTLAFADTAYYKDNSNWTDGVLYIDNHLIEADNEIIQGAYTIKDGTICIANHAFDNCFDLTSVTIPDSVTGIGVNAFAGCDLITDVFYSGTKEQWNDIVIADGNECLTGATMHFTEPTTVPSTTPSTVPSSDKPVDALFVFSEADVTSKETADTLKYASKAALTRSELIAAVTSANENATLTVKDKDGNELVDDAIPGTGSTVTVTLGGDSVTKTIIVMGDTDGDSSVNATDARLALRAAAKLDTLEGVYAIAADTDGDDNINATDSRMILRAAAKLDDPSAWLLAA